MSALPKSTKTGEVTAIPPLGDEAGVLVKEKDFKRVADRIYVLAGIYLPMNPKNLALVSNRMAKLLRKYSQMNLDQILSAVERGDLVITKDFISALTTNKTEFFREKEHFDFLAKWLQSRSHQPVRIWCAASSTGQEPYTLAMIVWENLPESSRKKSRILATDIDHEVLEKASLGEYTGHELHGLSLERQKKFFNKKEGDVYSVDSKIRDLVQFGRFNLVTGEYRKFSGQFDVIFCRNVLIYFYRPTVEKVLRELAGVLGTGGYLFLGHSESGLATLSGLKSVGQSILTKS
jgi:chemotaxis protein methyltransferase CheR